MTISAFLTEQKGRRGNMSFIQIRLTDANQGFQANEIVVHRLSAFDLVLESDHSFAVGDAVHVRYPGGKSRSKIIWIDGRLACCRFGRPIAPRWSDEPHDSADGASSRIDDEPFATAESLGARIRRLRHQRHLTQSDLARQMGVSNPAVCGWELDRSLPQAGRLPALAAILGVNTSELVGTPDRSGLQGQVASARAAIAKAAGTTADRVRIYIDL